MARRYGVLPSDIKNLSVTDFQFNMFIMNKGIQRDNRDAKKQQPGKKYQRQGRRGR